MLDYAKIKSAFIRKSTDRTTRHKTWRFIDEYKQLIQNKIRQLKGKTPNDILRINRLDNNLTIKAKIFDQKRILSKTYISYTTSH